MAIELSEEVRPEQTIRTGEVALEVVTANHVRVKLDAEELLDYKPERGRKATVTVFVRVVEVNA